MVGIVIAFVLLVVGKVLVSLLSKEVEGRLDWLCALTLKVARWRLPANSRVELHDEEWLPELTHILERDAERPITRFVQGARYSFGLVLATRRIARVRGACGPRWGSLAWLEQEAGATGWRGWFMFTCIWLAPASLAAGGLVAGVGGLLAGAHVPGSDGVVQVGIRIGLLGLFIGAMLGGRVGESLGVARHVKRSRSARVSE